MRRIRRGTGAACRSRPGPAASRGRSPRASGSRPRRSSAATARCWRLARSVNCLRRAAASGRSRSTTAITRGLRSGRPAWRGRCAAGRARTRPRRWRRRAVRRGGPRADVRVRRGLRGDLRAVRARLPRTPSPGRRLRPFGGAWTDRPGALHPPRSQTSLAEDLGLSIHTERRRVFSPGTAGRGGERASRRTCVRAGEDGALWADVGTADAAGGGSERDTRLRRSCCRPVSRPGARDLAAATWPPPPGGPEPAAHQRHRSGRPSRSPRSPTAQQRTQHRRRCADRR